ncbi:hypothetical protein Q8A67_004318 [Cirrhinus molitorella]|uniref:Uncharacterized protein n=1 Tax=Cirrhinus molitorella TaxID=172907 RepID=A0AA88PXZ0_9TELE|nr:hypothetical protein Q8A67_004318 [Cirrhinus molitorella]
METPTPNTAPNVTPRLDVAGRDERPDWTPSVWVSRFKRPRGCGVTVAEMYKVDMLKRLTTVVLLTSVLDAAPLMPGEPADRDHRRIDTDIEENAAQATRIFEKLLKTRPMTTFPDGDGKTVALKALEEIITVTSSPNVRDKTLDTGVNNPLKTLTILSDGHEEIRDGSLRIDRTTSSPDSQRQTEKNRLFRLSKLIDSSEHDDTPAAAKQSDAITGDPGAREELVKMLSALEELHKLMNSTLSHRITFITRGSDRWKPEIHHSDYYRQRWDFTKGQH